MEFAPQVKRVLWTALALNLLSAAAKTVYGVWSGTLSMVADGIHSFADAGSSVMGLISVKYASRPSDRNHHYGHQKFETLAALGIGAFIALTGWEVLRKAVHRLFVPDPGEFHMEGAGIMLFSMAVNLWISWYERKKGKEYNSAILRADAYHTASDIWVSASVLLSLAAIKYGVHWVDPAVSLVLSLYFFYVAFNLVRETGMILSDAAYIDTNEIKELVKSVPGVISCHRIRTRGRPGEAFVALNIQVDAATDTATSHAIVHKIENAIKEKMNGIRDVLIHTEPYPDPDPDSYDD